MNFEPEKSGGPDISPIVRRLAANSRRAFLRKGSLAAVAGGVACLGLNKAARAAYSGVNADYVDLAQMTYTFRSIEDHENEHVAFLVKALGTAARPAPTIHNLTMDTIDDFVAAAQAFENTGTAAYLTAAPYIDSSAYLAAALSIATIEARHSSYLNVLSSDPLTGHMSNLSDNETFESTTTLAAVGAAIAPFIKSLNGGAAPSFTTTKSAANDIDILNVALLLEYIEADFYNINVKRFF